MHASVYSHRDIALLNYVDLRDKTSFDARRNKLLHFRRCEVQMKISFVIEPLQ